MERRFITYLHYWK